MNGSTIAEMIHGGCELSLRGARHGGDTRGNGEGWEQVRSRILGWAEEFEVPEGEVPGGALVQMLAEEGVPLPQGEVEGVAQNLLFGEGTREFLLDVSQVEEQVKKPEDSLAGLFPSLTGDAIEETGGDLMPPDAEEADSEFTLAPGASVGDRESAEEPQSVKVPGELADLQEADKAEKLAELQEADRAPGKLADPPDVENAPGASREIQGNRRPTWSGPGANEQRPEPTNGKQEPQPNREQKEGVGSAAPAERGLERARAVVGRAGQGEGIDRARAALEKVNHRVEGRGAPSPTEGQNTETIPMEPLSRPAAPPGSLEAEKSPPLKGGRVFPLDVGQSPGGAPLRRGDETFLRLRVKDLDSGPLMIRLRTGPGELVGRMQSQDASLMRDLSGDIDSLRRNLQDLGYGSVDLQMGRHGGENRGGPQERSRWQMPPESTPSEGGAAPGEIAAPVGNGTVNVLV